MIFYSKDYSKTACERILECGHLCGGVRDESICLPCLQGCSHKCDIILKQDGDDMCMVCFTDGLASAPALQLKCGHVFHYHCCRSVLQNRWAGPRITFSFSLCPICKVCGELSYLLLPRKLLLINMNALRCQSQSVGTRARLYSSSGKKVIFSCKYRFDFSYFYFRRKLTTNCWMTCCLQSVI